LMCSKLIGYVRWLHASKTKEKKNFIFMWHYYSSVWSNINYFSAIWNVWKKSVAGGFSAWQRSITLSDNSIDDIKIMPDCCFMAIFLPFQRVERVRFYDDVEAFMRNYRMRSNLLTQNFQ
jgi:hypothetical protein